MKLNKIFYFGFILFLLMFNKICKAQDTTIYVTDVLLENSSGSLDSVLYKARPIANTGRNVTVLFSAPGLCQIDQALPVINITSGSITLKKDPATNIEQGIRCDTTNMVTNRYGFSINVGANTSITIDGLTIRDFIRYIDYPNRNTLGYSYHGVDVVNSQNLTVKNCLFENNRYSIYYKNNSRNVFIENNHFTDCQYAIEEYGSVVTTFQASSIIQDNVFENSINWYPSSYAVRCLKSNISQSNFNINHRFKITNNNMNGYPYCGVSIYNSYGEAYLLDDTTFKVSITQNIIDSNYVGIWFICPFNRFEVDSNTFADNQRHIDVQDREMVSIDNPFGIDFISPNTFSLSQKNASNVFNLSSDCSFNVIGFFGDGVNIIGQNLQSKIRVSNGIFSNIRENKIFSTSPIGLSTTNSIMGNYNISPPTLDTVMKSGSSLIIKYRLNGVEHEQENADFVVEFFKSNRNNYLLEYIGNHTVQTLTGAEYTAILNFPSSSLVPDTIVATVTSLGNQVSPNAPIGTSQVTSYKKVTQSPCFTGELSFCFPEQICAGEEVVAQNNTLNPPVGSNIFYWNYGDGSETTLDSTHIFTSIGNFTVTLIIPAYGVCPKDTISKVIVVDTCAQNCINCISSFAPEPGKKYVLSAWVKESGAIPSKTSYTFASVMITYIGQDAVQPKICLPKGSIIDGWQRIEEEFLIPEDATSIEIKLVSSSGDCYFDDIRIFPFDATMKSYVYDPITLRLVSELDEHNYATFYEYDEEGKLVRVKKETERGVMTIKENKNSFIKR